MKENVTVRVTSYNSPMLNMTASVPGGGMTASMAAFLINPAGDLYCEMLHVEPQHRCQGVACALFDHPEHYFRKKAGCSLELTRDSILFFQSSGIEIDSRAIVRFYDDLTGIGGATNEAD